MVDLPRCAARCAETDCKPRWQSVSPEGRLACFFMGLVSAGGSALQSVSGRAPTHMQEVPCSSHGATTVFTPSYVVRVQGQGLRCAAVEVVIVINVPPPAAAERASQRTCPSGTAPLRRRLHGLIRGSRQPITNPRRIPPTIQNGIDPGNIVLDAVVHSERKTPGEKPVVAKMQGVDAGIELQRVDVGENGIEEIVAQFRYLAFVEPVAVNEVL